MQVYYTVKTRKLHLNIPTKHFVTYVHNTIQYIYLVHIEREPAGQCDLDQRNERMNITYFYPSYINLTINLI